MVLIYLLVGTLVCIPDVIYTISIKEYTVNRTNGNCGIKKKHSCARSSINLPLLLIFVHEQLFKKKSKRKGNYQYIKCAATL